MRVPTFKTSNHVRLLGLVSTCKRSADVRSCKLLVDRSSQFLTKAAYAVI
jgi:hypothetical protein